MINILKCKIFKHNFIKQSCPFTGLTYNICMRCGKAYAIN